MNFERIRIPLGFKICVAKKICFAVNWALMVKKYLGNLGEDYSKLGAKHVTV